MKRFAPRRHLGSARNATLAAMLSLALGGALLVAPRGALGQTEKLLKAEQILDKYVDAIGGKAARKKIKNRVVKATFEMPGQETKGALTIYTARPNKVYSILEIPGVMTQERGTDGKVAWARHSIMGARLIEGDEREQFMREAIFDSEAEWRGIYKSAKTLGVEDVEGKPAYKVELAIDDEENLIGYYDAKSYLLVKTVMTAKTQMGDMPVENRISDYKEVGGVLTPHKYRQKVRMMKQTITLDSVEVNAKIDKERFELPDDIKNLLKKKESEDKKVP